MKSYAAFVAVAAMHGATAAPQSSGSNLPLAPNRGPGLPPTHVVNTQVPTLVNSACYQNSTGQLERSADGTNTNIKYPCISEQEITGYCHQQFENDVEGMKSCLFNTDSTYESDHKCCIACRNLNGDGSAGTADDADKFIQGLKDRFVNNNPDNRRFADVAAELRQAIKPVQLPSTARVENGVGDINILSYCPKPKLPQQAGSPKSKDPAPTTTAATPAATSSSVFQNTTQGGQGGQALQEHKFAEATIEFYYLGQFSYGSAQASLPINASASASANETAIVRMQQEFKLQYCVTCAAPGQSQAELEKSRVASNNAVKLEPLEQKVLPETCQKASEFQVEAKAAVPAEPLPVVDLDKCSCLPPTLNSFAPASPAAVGDGKEFFKTYVVEASVNINTRIGGNDKAIGGSRSRPQQIEANGPKTNGPKTNGPKTNGPNAASTPKQVQPVPQSDAAEQEPVLYCE